MNKIPSLFPFQVWKALNRVTFLTLALLLLSQCEMAELEPEDIFEEPDGVPANAQALPLQNFGNNILRVDPEDMRETADGYQVKGALYADAAAGSYTVTSGDFKITTDAQGNTTSVEGYGTLQFPETGFFKGQIEFGDIYGAFIKYEKGKWFKENREGGAELPLDDETYYFHFSLDNIYEEGPDGLAMVGNMLFNFPAIYLDPKDPAIFFDGDASLYETADRPQKTTMANGKQKFKGNKSKTKWAINACQFGISIGSNLHFTPFTYSEKLTELMGENGFAPFPGFMYVGGEVSFKKYPILIDGRLLTASEMPESAADFFLQGPNASGMKYGVNGTVKFGHALLDFIPLDLEVEMGNSTLEYSAVNGENYLRMAGEYDAENFFKAVLPEVIFEYVPFVAQNSMAYLSLGESPEDWQFAFETKAKLNIPAAGQQEMKKTIISFGPQGAHLSLEVNLPFGIGNTLMSGQINEDGTFELRGKREVDIDFGNNARIKTLLDVKITQEGVFLDGEVNVPAVGMVKVHGQITQNGLIMQGNQLMDIDFGNGFVVSSQMDIELNTNTGVFLQGNLNLPHGVGSFSVTGEVSSNGIAFTGRQNTHLPFAPGAAFRSELSLRAATFNNPGIFLSGQVDLPGNISGIAIEGQISAQGIYMSGEHYVDLNFGHGVEIHSLMQLTASSFGSRRGVFLNGMMQLPHGMANMQVEASLNAQGLYFLAKGSTRLPFADGLRLTANLEIGAATYGNPGATIRGSFKLPGNLITAQINRGEFTANGFAFDATARGNLNFSVTRLRGYINIDADHRNGLDLSGKLHLPFSLGEKEISGEISRNDFSFSASSSVSKSKGPISIGGSVRVGFSKDNFSFRFSGSACFDAKIEKICIDPSISLEPTWGGDDKGLKACMNFPGIGNKCLTIK